MHLVSAQEHPKNLVPVTADMRAYLQPGKTCLTILVGAPTFQGNVEKLLLTAYLNKMFTTKAISSVRRWAEHTVVFGHLAIFRDERGHT